MGEPSAPRWRRVAAGREGVVHVADQALSDPEAARRLAKEARFAVDSPFYPGVRAPLPAGLQDEMLSLVREALAAAGDHREPVMDLAAFALVCRPPADLSPPQRLPHFDGTSDGLYACVLYLAAHQVGGTAFYRHISTGYEMIDDARQPAYFEALRGDLARLGPPPRGYFRGDGGIFAQTCSFSADFNRMVLYPGNLLHSGIIADDPAPVASILDGRLTITCFLTLR